MKFLMQTRSSEHDEAEGVQECVVQVDTHRERLLVIERRMPQSRGTMHTKMDVSPHTRAERERKSVRKVHTPKFRVLASQLQN